MERCPTCRASMNGNTTICRRCSTDLSFALAAEKKGVQMESLAVRQLVAGDTQKALDAANQALTFKHTDRAIFIKKFISCLIKHY